ncbi:MAG: hypothetical protein WCK33_05880 [Phycisphaerae bacterium]
MPRPRGIVHHGRRPRFTGDSADDPAANQTAIAFLRGYDPTRRLMQEALDLPGPLRDLFIRLCVHNGGVLTARKRESHFSRLADAEIADLEEAVRRGFASGQA